ncbi:DegT/DnrJ/EryC1/StrS family aminotransferase [Lentisphaerota bacterium WC36G]|nr:DegT/DnrJ/EryC1/StrS family aminotransferase [Lentisphaerae bacterium WC36]
MIEKFKKNILVTEPIAPDKDAILSQFSSIIDSKWFTNMGQLHNQFEEKLKEYLKVKNISIFNNGTIALITALKALDLPTNSEVITTPFTFAATPHAIAWNNLKPVFADIDENTMGLDPKAIEAAITDKTSAILAVHVYGFPCDVENIDKIAKKHNLKVIYDAAHAFSTEINGKSICNWGDITMLSFHATKLFNSIEGGALVYNDKRLGKKIYELRNFGIKEINHDDAVKDGIKNENFIDDIGINGKMNEFQAAWGIQTLEIVKEEQGKRATVAQKYIELLKDIDFIEIPKFPENVTNSMQYLPVLINNYKRDELYNFLKNYNVFSRKYFYPLCSEFGCYKDLPSSKPSNLKIAHQLSRKVLCLPFYGELVENDCEIVKNICKIIKEFK